MNSSQRKHIRLREFDYSSENAYFITICTKDREQFFGRIENEVMELSPIGKISKQFWFEIPEHYQHVILDEFAVMPNHIHGILILDYSGVDRTRHGVSDPNVSQKATSIQSNQFGKPVSGSISVIINQYKSSVKRWCNKNGFDHFQWQSRFYDHVIRDGQSFENIRDYIANNVRNWIQDEFFP